MRELAVVLMIRAGMGIMGDGMAQEPIMPPAKSAKRGNLMEVMIM